MAALRPLRLVITAILAVAAAFLLSGTASAQGTYPPSQPTVSASATTVVEGNSLTVTASGLTPGDQVTATVTPGGTSLGTKTVGANGVVSFTFSTAGFGPGNFTVRLTSPLGVSLSVPFTVTSASPAAFASGPQSSGGSGGIASGSGSSGLAFTGAAAVVPISIAGLALVGLGAGAVIVSRRRQSGAAS